MAVSLTPVIVANSDTFQQWVTVTNAIVNAINTVVLTANGLANGSSTTGNASLTGQFGANVIVVYEELRGGTFTTSGNLVFSSNLNIQGNFVFGNSSATISLGNSTVNVTANSTTLAASRFSAQTGNAGFAANTSALWLNGKSYTNLDSHIVVANNGANVGDRPVINFVSSGAIELTTVDDANNSCVTITISANAQALSTVGTNNQITFNDAGFANGSAGLTFSKASNTLTVGNTVEVATVKYDQHRTTSINSTVSVNTQVVLDNWLKADFQAANYTLSVKDNAANAFVMTQLMVLHDTGTAYITEFGKIWSNTNFASFAVETNTTSVRLLYTATTSNSTVKGQRTLISI